MRKPLQLDSSLPIEDRVLLFVAHHCAVERSNLSFDSRLYHDFGLDGDDVAEFFDAFRREFSVDLGSLPQHYRKYSGSEFTVGFRRPETSVACAIVVVVALVVWPWHPLYSFLLLPAAFGLALVSFFYWRASKRFLPLRVATLVEAAQTRAWPKAHE
jgi:hypothetical protein